MEKRPSKWMGGAGCRPSRSPRVTGLKRCEDRPALKGAASVRNGKRNVCDGTGRDQTDVLELCGDGRVPASAASKHFRSSLPM